MKIFKSIFLTFVILITICIDIVPASPKAKKAAKKVRQSHKKLPVNHIVQIFENIDKFPMDRRSYKGLKLSNELKVLLVGDPSIEKSIVCLSVEVGSLNDVVAVPGLANFVGNMLLFAGDQRYPGHNEFREFIGNHGGRIYLPKTGLRQQKLYFEIKQPYLAESLIRFAEIIIQSRLLNAVAEVPILEEALNNALEEFALRKSQIEDQILEVEKSLSKQNSMYNHFHVGIPGALYQNGAIVGLPIDNKTLYQHVQTFYKMYYSSNLMNLVIIHRENEFEELQEVIASSFGCIENKEKVQKKYEYPKHHPWGPDQLKQIVHIVPEDKNVQSLRLMFPAPYDFELYGTTPAIYVANFLTYDGKGSLVSFLRKKKLCTDLVLEMISDAGIGFIKIMCDITDNGVKHNLYFIIYLIFQYLYILNDDYDKEEWVFKELMEIHELKFRNFDNSDVDPLEYVQALCASLQIVPFEDIHSYEYVHKHGKPEHKKQLLQYLKPENMNIILVSKQSLIKNEVYMTEKHLGTQYKVNKISDQWIQIWSRREYTHKLVPLQRNEFLAKNFEVYSLGEGEPRDPYIIHKSSKLEIWFKQDDKFGVPHMSLNLEISSSTANLGPFNAIMMRLFVGLLTSYLEEEYGYFTRNVFLAWSLSSTDCGFCLHINGYNDKLPFLLEKILSKIINFENDINDDVRETFIELQTEYFESVQEILSGDQTDQATWLTEHLLIERSWPAEGLLQALHKLKFEDMKKFSTQAFQRNFIRGLIHGNCTNAQAKEIANIIEEQFRSSNEMLQQELIFNRRRVKIADGSHFVYQVMSNQKDIVKYSSFFQLRTMSSEFQNVKSLMLTEIIPIHCTPYVIDEDTKEPPVIECKTLQDMNGFLGFFIKVRSKKKSPYNIDRKVERFLLSMAEYISNMKNDELDSVKKAVAKKKYKKPSQLMDLSEMYWNEITKRQYDFGRSDFEILLLYSVSVEDMRDFFQETFGLSVPQRRKLAVHIFPRDMEKNKQSINNFIYNVSPPAKLIGDPFTFKISSGLFALDYRPAH